MCTTDTTNQYIKIQSKLGIEKHLTRRLGGSLFLPAPSVEMQGEGALPCGSSTPLGPSMFVVLVLCPHLGIPHFELLDAKGIQIRTALRLCLTPERKPGQETDQ